MKREIATGAAWMIFMRLCDRVLGLVSTLVLARLLLPSDFGLVAMAMSFIALIELAGAFSFEVALIQRAELTRAHYDTACRALDRVLRAEHYWVSAWYKPSHWIAFWDLFAWPATKPRYARGIPETWWSDTEKTSKAG